ncbi:MAG: sigma-70 family RNA polymerase sigma factor [Planctomycetaceae bacterium]|nr:sigma-70 family RNA polymerase sigma factor [Planctomycetaceae bacterium]
MSNAHATLEELARVHAERAWRLGCALMGNEADAEDVVQQAFVIAAVKLEHVAVRQPWPWFAAVIGNVARHHRRKFVRRRGEELNMDVPGPDAAQPDSVTNGRELSAQLKDALAGLPEAEREAISMVHLSGLSYREASEALNVPRSTIDSRVKLGIEKLRQRLKTSEASVLTSLSALPFGMPVGGLEHAAGAWLGAAKAAIASGSTITGITTAGIVGEVIMMKKMVLVIGAVACAGLGLATGIIVSEPAQSQPAPLTTQDDMDIVESELNSPTNHTSTRNSGLPASTVSDDQEVVAKELLQNLREKAARGETLAAERKATIEELKAQLEILKKPEASGPTEEELAAVKARAKELLDTVKKGIEANDKDAVLKAMAELRDTGLKSYLEYYEAYIAVNEVGNPWTANNPLGLSRSEASTLMTAEQLIFALDDPNNDVPSHARVSAIWGAPWGALKTEDVVAKYAKILETSREESVLSAVLQNIVMNVKEPALIKAVIPIATNTGFSEGLRAMAMHALLFFGDKVQPSDIASLEHDTMPGIVKKYGLFKIVWDAPRDGLLVLSLFNSNPDFGLKAGDILVSCDGKGITDAESLTGALQTILTDNGNSSGAKSVLFEFYRGNAIETANVPVTSSWHGVNGVHVKRKIH